MTDDVEARLAEIGASYYGPEDYLESREDIRWLLSLVRELQAEVARLRNAIALTSNEVEQILGKALGYPAYGPEMFENDTPDGSVCVGDHVPESLALEAAHRLSAAESREKELREALMNLARWDSVIAAIRGFQSVREYARWVLEEVNLRHSSRCGATYYGVGSAPGSNPRGFWCNCPEEEADD